MVNPVNKIAEAMIPGGKTPLDNLIDYAEESIKADEFTKENEKLVLDLFNNYMEYETGLKRIKLKRTKGEPVIALKEKAKKMSSTELSDAISKYRKEGRELDSLIFKKEYFKRLKLPALYKFRNIPVINKIIRFFSKE